MYAVWCRRRCWLPLLLLQMYIDGSGRQLTGSSAYNRYLKDQA